MAKVKKILKKTPAGENRAGVAFLRKKARSARFRERNESQSGGKENLVDCSLAFRKESLPTL